MRTGELNERPLMFFVGSLKGVSEKDAETYVRGLVSRYCENPAAAHFRVHRLREDTVAYEVQEGGARRAWLPSILQQMTQRGERAVEVETGGRVVELTLSEAGAIDSRLLPESHTTTPEKRLEPSRNGPRLKPYETDHSRLLVAALSMCCAAAVLLGASIAVDVTSVRAATSQSASIQTPANSLPVAHWPAVGEDEYVHSVRFQNQRWLIDKRRVSGEEGVQGER